MPEPSTLGLVADLVIRRAMADTGNGPELAAALTLAYPFSDDPAAYEVWIEALRRHGIAENVPPPPGGHQV